MDWLCSTLPVASRLMEVNMEPRKVKPAGIVFIISGIVFFAAAGLAHQVAFYGVGAALIGVGASHLGKRNGER